MRDSLFFRASPLLRFTIKEKSMKPFLKEGDSVVVSKIFLKLRVGDVVIFHHPTTPPYTFIKRISKIDNEKYFVEGDNKKMSFDSRKFGYIKRKDIIGKVIIKL